MKWIFRLLLGLLILAGLAWGALVWLAPGQIDRMLANQFRGQITTGSVAMSLSGQVTLTDVTLTLPDAPQMTLAQLTLRPVWEDQGLGLRLEGTEVSIASLATQIARVDGVFYPRSRETVIGGFALALTDLRLPDMTLATAQLTGQLDAPAQEVTDIVFDGTGLTLALAAPQGALDLQAETLSLTSDRLSPRLLAPLAIALDGVTGEVLQGTARLWVAGLENARITLDTLEMPLDQPSLDLVLRAETTAPTTPALLAWIETETTLDLIRPAGCTDITCVAGLQGLVSQNSWEVAAGEESTRGGFTCPALPCLLSTLRFDPVEVTDVQAFATGLGSTRTLSPFVLGFVAAELSKVARPQE